jgi:Protein of unknown function (DUF3071)
MHELRLVAVSEDGSYAILAVPGRGGRFSLPIDDRLRTVARGQFSRLAQYEIEVESPLRPKEIQDRIRAGETADEIADAAGVPIERVRRFEGPVLAEREYRAQEAQRATVRSPGDPGPGPLLGDIVAERLVELGAGPDDARWDSRKRADGNWQVQVAFTVGGRPQVAEWVFDPRRRHVMPADDNAARMSLPGAEPPQPAPPTPGEATVTRLAPRLNNAASHAAPARPAVPAPGLSAGHAPGGWARQERPTPVRPPVPEPVPAPPPEPVQAPVVATREDHPPVPAPAEAAPSQMGTAQTATPAPPPEPTAEPAGRQSRKAARNRRSSVPSWDEIMFGSSRQQD